MNKEIRIDIIGGYLRAFTSEDPDYPGIWVEFVRDDEPETTVSRPQILFEQPQYYNKGEARVLVWDNPNEEDFTKEIYFKK